MKILNLYAGIGGNRKLWDGDIQVTAVELNEKIADIYKHFFPQDTMIIADAHQYLLEHFAEYDFIWASPPCPTHSRIRRFLSMNNVNNKPVFPDMKLYEEIIFLQSYYSGKWCVENVVGFYEPLIKPFVFKEHYYWSNFPIIGAEHANRNHNNGREVLQEIKGFNLDKFDGIDKRHVLRNCVEPEAGLAILNAAFKQKQITLEV